jgi:3'-5' exonuclease
MLHNLFIIDIETVPMVENFEDLDNNWKELWTDKTSKVLPNYTPEDTWKMRGGIMAEFGKIVCISTAYFYEDINRNECLRVKSIFGEDEKLLLEQFVQMCNKVFKKDKNFVFAGHNIKEFDVPYICRRLLINNLVLPEYFWLHDRKPWEVKMLDTLSWWRFGDNKNYTSLHLLANALGIETSKTDMDGSMVQEVFYKENNLNRIASYCQKDVIVTANIILKFNGKNILQTHQIMVVE